MIRRPLETKSFVLLLLVVFPFEQLNNFTSAECLRWFLGL